MTQRALQILQKPFLTKNQLKHLQRLEETFDELIFVLDSLQDPLSWKEALQNIQSLLIQHLHRPFYLFPTLQKTCPMLHYLRLRILCPSFHRVSTENPALQQVLQQVFRVPVEVLSFQDDPIPTTQPLSKARGLWITRAQPFHQGHALFVEKIGREQEEVIVVIAMANMSHTKENIATAGERLSMIQPVLQRLLGSKYYLVPMPYSDFSLENFYELELLLPSFQAVYTHNPSVEALAQTAGYPVKKLSIPSTVSASSIRSRIQQNFPYKEDLPPEVFHYIQSSEIPKRLQLLHEQEQRELVCAE